MIHDHRIEQINQESEEFAALELVFKEFDLRWSHFVGQVGGEVKVYSDA